MLQGDSGGHCAHMLHSDSGEHCAHVLHGGTGHCAHMYTKDLTLSSQHSCPLETPARFPLYLLHPTVCSISLSSGNFPESTCEFPGSLLSNPISYIF